jgi:hypothetical protein
MPRLETYTEAGERYRQSLTEWLQDTRLMSEAIFQLYQSYKNEGKVNFNPSSWPKRGRENTEAIDFQISPVDLGIRMSGLLKDLWANRFIFLETLWEEYLQQLVLELRLKDASIFSPFCEQSFMAEVIQDVLLDKLQSIDEVKDEVAARFAAGITRKSWDKQWDQLKRLEIGLTNSEKTESWWTDLDIYFEVRNCIIHRQGSVSPLLNLKTSYYTERNIEIIEVWPQSLDHNRHQFVSCLQCIESKIKSKFSS